MTETEKLFEFINDIDLILKSNEEYFIKYLENLDEVMCCLHGDTIEYYRMYNKKERKQFLLRLILFINSNMELKK